MPAGVREGSMKKPNQKSKIALPPMVLIRWKDAMTREAPEPVEKTKAELADMMCIGFVLDETSDIILIGMEMECPDGSPSSAIASRWRINIPKGQITERRELSVQKKRRGDHQPENEVEIRIYPVPESSRSKGNKVRVRKVRGQEVQLLPHPPEGRDPNPQTEKEREHPGE
jgi:hypothetical protein